MHQLHQVLSWRDGILSLLVTGHCPRHPGVCHQSWEPVPLQPVQQHPSAPLSPIPGHQVSDDMMTWASPPAMVHQPPVPRPVHHHTTVTWTLKCAVKPLVVSGKVSEWPMIWCSSSMPLTCPSLSPPQGSHTSRRAPSHLCWWPRSSGSWGPCTSWRSRRGSKHPPCTLTRDLPRRRTHLAWKLCV